MLAIAEKLGLDERVRYARTLNHCGIEAELGVSFQFSRASRNG